MSKNQGQGILGKEKGRSLARNSKEIGDKAEISNSKLDIQYRANASTVSMIGRDT